MKIVKITLISLFTLISSFTATSAEDSFRSLKHSGHYMIDLTQENEAQNWRITNDGVMGGRSEGSVWFDKSATIFSGNISLDNNGGFSSVYRPTPPLAKDLDTIAIDMLGDGYVYQFRVAIAVNGYRLAYKHEFETVKGQRQVINLPLKDFEATFRGRIIQGAPQLRSEQLKQLGLLITNKKEHAFSLTLYHIKLFNSRTSQVI